MVYALTSPLVLARCISRSHSHVSLSLLQLIEIDEHMSQSKKIMNQMYLNVIGNKLVLILIIMAELISIGLIVYFKYIK